MILPLIVFGVVRVVLDILNQAVVVFGYFTTKHAMTAHVPLNRTGSIRIDVITPVNDLSQFSFQRCQVFLGVRTQEPVVFSNLGFDGF